MEFHYPLRFTFLISQVVWNCTNVLFVIYDMIWFFVFMSLATKNTAVQQFSFEKSKENNHCEYHQYMQQIICA